MLVKNTGYYINNRFFQSKSPNLTRAKIWNQCQGDSVCFGSLHDEDKLDNVGWVFYDTDLFRNLDMLNFITKHTRENFPKGAVVVDAGCSIGEGAYSMGMLLDDDGQKFKIIGYDINPKAIYKANKGVYRVFTHDSYELDQFLISDEPDKDPDKERCKKIFRKYFEETKKPEDLALFNGVIDRFYKEAKEKMGENFREVYFKPKDKPPFKLRDKLLFKKAKPIKDKIEFRVGDINDIGQWDLEDEKPNVFICKNALYHITDNSTNRFMGWDIDEAMYRLGKVVKNVNKLLPENGLFVIGNLPRDHLFRDVNDKIIEPSPVHELLKRNGFVPVLDSDLPEGNLPWGYNGKKLPSIWKKVRSHLVKNETKYIKI